MAGWFSSGRIDLTVIADALRRSFWFLPVLAMLGGGGLGFLIPMLDTATGGTVGFFTTSDRDSARGLLETIATVTVSVAGVAFSVTVVALQLASQQLGPRVLRTFQADRLSQATLAVFLGLFVYALIALGRVSTISLGEGVESPNLVLTFGVLVAVLAFGLFAAFIQNTVVSLQASTVISRIGADAVTCLERPYPSGLGESGAEGAGQVRRSGAPTSVTAPTAGFLNAIPIEAVIAAAASHDGLVIQRVPLGDYVIGGLEIAEVHAGENPESLAEQITDMIEIGEERTLVQDVAFPVRQLTDVALRALSPSLNDPTTAETAVGALTHVLAEFARQDPVSSERADGDGVVRFIAAAPDLDDLVRLGFEQVRIQSEEFPVLRARLGQLLQQLCRIATEHGSPTEEIDRQLDLIESGGS